MSEILLIGGGGHCKAVIDVIELEGKYKIIGIIDRKENVGKEVMGYKIIDCDENLEKYLFVKNALITVGHIDSPEVRINLFNRCCELGFNMPIIISPLAYVSRHAKIGDGTVVMHHAIINAGAYVGRNCIINTKALIEHDAIVEDNCHISTGAIVNGGVVVKEGTFLGSNSTTKQYVEIRGFIKAGSVAK